MRAARYSGQRSVAVQEAPVPEPGPGEVLVRVRACGICGSDLHAFRGSGIIRTDGKSYVAWTAARRTSCSICSG